MEPYDQGKKSLELRSKIENLLTQKEAEISALEFVDSLIEYSFVSNISEMSFEPQKDIAVVSLKDKETVENTFTLSRELYAVILVKIKIVSGMRIDIHSMAQAGIFRVNLVTAGKALNISAVITPSLFGESIALRFIE